MKRSFWFVCFKLKIGNAAFWVKIQRGRLNQVSTFGLISIKRYFLDRIRRCSHRIAEQSSPAQELYRNSFTLTLLYSRREDEPSWLDCHNRYRCSILTLSVGIDAMGGGGMFDFTGAPQRGAGTQREVTAWKGRDSPLMHSWLTWIVTSPTSMRDSLRTARLALQKPPKHECSSQQASDFHKFADHTLL